MTFVQLIEALLLEKRLVIGAKEQGGEVSKREKSGGVEDMNDSLCEVLRVWWIDLSQT